MLKYIIRRIIAMIPVVIGITFLVFMIMQLAPGDPVQMILGDNASPEAVEAMRDEMGLNDNVLIQYGRYLVNLAQGDMGTSYVNKRPVADEVFSRVPATFKLAAVAAVVSIVIAIPLGILAAIKQNTLFDHSSMVVSMIGISMPAFWLALMIMLLFSLKLGCPPRGPRTGGNPTCCHPSPSASCRWPPLPEPPAPLCWRPSARIISAPPAPRASRSVR